MGQFYGMYRGICSNNNDPEGRYRIRLKVPQLLGDHETAWAWPCVPPGWHEDLHEDHDNFYVGSRQNDAPVPHTLTQKTPHPGQTVWVMFEAGDIEKPIWMGVW